MTTVAHGTARTHEMNMRLRADILRGDLPPGTPLRLAELAKRFDVSTSVVREALIRLAEQNLATLSPNQGFRVVEVSLEDLEDITSLRVTLEGLALRLSIENGTVAWESEVVAAHHVLARASLAEDDDRTTDEWSHAHSAFHDALGAGCGSPRLIAMTHSLRDSSELYRRMSAGVAGTRRDVAAEHRELMELATARRADDAVASLGRHIWRTTDSLRPVLSASHDRRLTETD